MPKNPTPLTDTAIVLCTFNGERFLKPQIESLLAQSQQVTILAFDDRSTDSTLALLRSYESDRFLVHSNDQNLGYVKNFELGIQAALDAGFDYIALSDQDDIWHRNRIESGKVAIDQAAMTLPQLAHSDLQVIDEAGKTIAQSYFAMRNYRVDNKRNLELILGQNGVMGNTVLMNRALAELALPFPAKLHVHDYWLASIGELYGRRTLLTQATVDYRLHKGNASNSTGKLAELTTKPTSGLYWRKLLMRNFKLPFKEDSRQEVIAYLINTDELPPLQSEDQQVLQRFHRYLSLEPPKWLLAFEMLKSEFLRPGWPYRCRFFFSLLFSRRYK